MRASLKSDITSAVIQKAMTSGASAAGIVRTDLLKTSPSHKLYGKIKWSENAKSALVLALAHKRPEPYFDW